MGKDNQKDRVAKDETKSALGGLNAELTKEVRK